MADRPRSRERNVTGEGKDVYRRGEGTGGGPVGSSDGYSGRGKGSSDSGGSAERSGGGGGGLIGIIAVVVALLGGGGLGLGGLLGGGGSAETDVSQVQQQSQYEQESGSQAYSTASILEALGVPSTYNAYTQSPASEPAPNSAGKLDTQVAAGSREKYTSIAGDGKDTVTLMVYLCGTDLESKNAMATADLSEMARARYGSDLHVIVFTGGCSAWQNKVVSSQKNQIYEVRDGGVVLLEEDMGNKSMTDPSNLSSFIRYCASKYPSNRNELILWDHGGGSVSGYGYDEKNKKSGSMSLSGIKRALEEGGVKFDFIGFDACLMATAENALMLEPYADYLIASEETEPGVGWYYTSWLTKLGADTSMPTIEIGKNITDDFVSVCAQKCRGQKTTLSVIDLAEFSNTVPEKLKAFSESLVEQIEDNGYKKISDARYNAREFAQSSKIDQVDLADLARRIGSPEGEALSEAIEGAVKYNLTGKNMSNANGVSIYFPYSRKSYVDRAVDTYDAIGMDDSYANCIREFAALEAGGQAATGGSSSPASILLGTGSGPSSAGSQLMGQLLGSFLSGSLGSVEGLTSSNSGFLSARSMSDEQTVEYISNNYLDPEVLVWTLNSDGRYQMDLTEKELGYIHSIDKNVFLDDGDGYIDMGLDNIFEYSDDGALLADTEKYWVAINQQPVPYYHLDTVEGDDGDEYSITGRVPAFLNGEAVNLILVFDNETPGGYVAGAQSLYEEEDTETIAKNMIEIRDGDVIDFLGDYYTYDGEYQSNYTIGDQVVVDGQLQVSDVSIEKYDLKITYRFTDIYNQEYWAAIEE